MKKRNLSNVKLNKPASFIFFIFNKYDIHSFKNKNSFKKSFFATG